MSLLPQCTNIQFAQVLKYILVRIYVFYVTTTVYKHTCTGKWLLVRVYVFLFYVTTTAMYKYTCTGDCLLVIVYLSDVTTTAVYTCTSKSDDDDLSSCCLSVRN